MIEVDPKDIVERKPGKKGRVNLSESDEVMEAVREDKRVQVAVLGVVEDDE